MSVEERFRDFTIPQKFSRVDPNRSVELHIGLDENGKKSIELRGNFAHRKIVSSGAIEVSKYTKQEYNTLRFSLINDEVSGLFYKFCDDLIEQTRNLEDNNQAYQIIVDRYFQWKKLFVSSRFIILRENEIMGLIGELLFLKGYLKDTFGIENALAGWSGQELTHKDYSYNDDWFEVKTISSGKNTVKISSIEQLSSDKDGELVVFSLEKMSEAYDGISLNNLVVEILNMFNSQEDKESFLSKVALRGYEYNNYYDNFVYEINGCYRYRVKKGFPVLKREMLPSEIVKASYEIDLSLIKSFLITE